MSSNEQWLASQWRFVGAQLPAPPASVLEIGCGQAGGFVPLLKRAGYVAVGVDPEAPAAPDYRRVAFERYEPAQPVHAVVACTALHHVSDLAQVIHHIGMVSVPGGVVVVVEWAWERFDEPTARWCFARLPPPGDEDGPNWLHQRRDQWITSAQPWEIYSRAWGADERLHTGAEILRTLDASVERRVCRYGPYFFPDLGETTEADELTAIGTGQIQATRIQYAGRLR